MTYRDTRHPAWLRVWLYAMDHDGVPLEAGQLRDATALDQRTLSRGLHAARRMGLLTADSNARCCKVHHVVEVPRAS